MPLVKETLISPAPSRINGLRSAALSGQCAMIKCAVGSYVSNMCDICPLKQQGLIVRPCEFPFTNGDIKLKASCCTSDVFVFRCVFSFLWHVHVSTDDPKHA